MNDSQESDASKDDSSKVDSSKVDSGDGGYNHWDCHVKNSYDGFDAAQTHRAKTYDLDLLKGTSGRLGSEIQALEEFLLAQGGGSSSHPQVQATLEQLRGDFEATNRGIRELESQINSIDHFMKWV